MSRATNTSSRFVTRTGTALFDPWTSTPLRFASYNAPPLSLVEDSPAGWQRPTPFEQHDLLASIARTGGRVARTYTLSIPKGPFDFGAHVVPAARYGSSSVFWALNEERMADLDTAIALAGAVGVRLVIPLIDKWEWWGGVASFARLYIRDGGAGEAEFFRDRDVIAGFKTLISAVLMRNNSRTGLLLNGAPPPSAWTLEIARHIRSIDANHLVMDGSYGLYGWPDDVLASPDIDMYSNHYYPLAFSLSDWQVWLAIGMGCVILVCLLLLVVVWLQPGWFPCTRSQPANAKKKKESAPPPATSPPPASSPASPPPSQPPVLLVPTANPPLRQTVEPLAQPPHGPPPPAAAPPASTPKTPEPKIKKRRSTRPPLTFRQKTCMSVLVLVILGCIAVTAYLAFQQIFLPNYAARAFLAGEFGLARSSVIESMMTAVVDSGIAGALVWSLRGHARDGGYYVHKELDGYLSYHYPGVPSNTSAGFPADGIQIVDIMSSASAQLASRTGYRLPIPSVPEPPQLLSASVDASGMVVLLWRGSTGAVSYVVEQSTNIGTESETRARAVPAAVESPIAGNRVATTVVYGTQTTMAVLPTIAPSLLPMPPVVAAAPPQVAAAEYVVLASDVLGNVPPGVPQYRGVAKMVMVAPRVLIRVRGVNA
ncbi:glycoside hydrolase superfamily, partial [Entophlyctis helioformis]